MILLAGVITFSLGACGQKESAQEDAKREEARQESEVTESSEEENSTETAGTASAETETSSSDNHILIAYFSVPEDINTAVSFRSRTFGRSGGRRTGCRCQTRISNTYRESGSVRYSDTGLP